MIPKHLRRAPPRAVAEDPLRETATRWVFTYLRHTREEARRAGLTLPQRLVLATLRRAGPVPVSRLTEWTGASLAAISGVLDGLDDHGLLSRRHGTEDRRTVFVSLSVLGQRRADRLEARDLARWRPLLRAIAPTDAAVAGRVLDRLNAGFSGSRRPRRAAVSRVRDPRRARPAAPRSRWGAAA